MMIRWHALLCSLFLVPFVLGTAPNAWGQYGYDAYNNGVYDNYYDTNYWDYDNNFWEEDDNREYFDNEYTDSDYFNRGYGESNYVTPSYRGYRGYPGPDYYPDRENPSTGYYTDNYFNNVYTPGPYDNAYPGYDRMWRDEDWWETDQFSAYDYSPYYDNYYDGTWWDW